MRVAIMTQDKAAELLKLGFLTEAFILSPLPLLGLENWYISFEPKLEDYDEHLELTRGGVRQFKTLDAANEVLEQIGFARYQVILRQ